MSGLPDMHTEQQRKREQKLAALAAEKPVRSVCAQTEQETFWLVWNPANPKTPEVSHTSEELAQTEAERLSTIHAQPIYVLKAVSVSLTPKTHTTRLAERF